MRRILVPGTRGLLLLFVILVPALGGCGGPAEPAATPPVAGRSNLLLVTLDTVRADHLGAYGGPRDASPAFDRLAAAGLLYEQCDSPSPLTLPAHASLLTGLEPVAHGLRANGGGRLAEGVTPLASVLRAAGWRTAAFVSSAVLDRAVGLDRGFDHYDDRMGVAGERRGDRTTDLALAWLAAGDESPWFLWVHLYDAHSPYEPPPTARARFPSEPYRAEIAFVDQQLQRLVEAVRARAARIAVVADHGEGLGEHGEREHGLLLYQSTLHVPLVLAGPGVAAGRRVSAPVRAQDLFATLLGLAGITPPEAGPSAALPTGAGPLGGPTQRSETLMPLLDYGWQPLASSRQGRFKLLRGSFDELFDLAADPKERHNLLATSRGSAPSPETLQALDALGRNLTGAAPQPGGEARSMTGPPGDAAQAEREFDPDRLRSLGYLGGTLPDGSAPRERPAAGPVVGPAGSRPDPRHRVDWHESVTDVLAAYRAGLYEEGLAQLQPLVREEPANLLLVDLAGSFLVALGRSREAVARYETVLERLPGRAAVRLHLAEALLQAGEHERAAAEARRSLADGVVRRSRAAIVLCDSLVALGRSDEARVAAAEQIDRIAPDDPLRKKVVACAGGQ